ncbi:hypothetical protein NUW58_g1614 [Xylaria curta]|uniref:Uncharacterized protein n=1 Tax=Xylaria curta TaxID=42375 RepID=A0ACC1PJH7_9PEZI|nr:hypothetical protein NUW58_g1614 [Xylaria curta]
MSLPEGAQARYKAVRDDLYSSLEPHLLTKRDNDETTRFATKHVARDVLRDEKLRAFYRCISPSGVDDDGNLGIGEDEFVRRVLERELQPFVATLVFIGAVMSAARTFITNVVAKPADIENQLPLKLARLKEIFCGDPTTINHFFSNQHRFCTLTLFHDETHMVLDDEDTSRLPCMREREIGKGAFGSVWEVEIPHGHFVVRTSGEKSLPRGSKVVARKDYRRQIHAQKDFENERDICKAIFHSPNHCDNVLLSYGTIEYSSGSVFSLFMPKAESDLLGYMKRDEGNNIRSIENMAKHISCAAGLARGVAYLHNGIELPGMGMLICLHRDLKPDNVLIFQEDGQMIWKICDFGLSRKKSLHVGSTTSPGHHTVSATQNPAGQGIYLAPESKSQRDMTSKSDVWSLGCIISELCVWLQKGYHSGVQEYAKSRVNHGNKSASFYTSRTMGGMKPNSQIKEWHKMLIADEKDVAIKQVLIDVLTYLEKNTFSIIASQRPEASKLKQRLEHAANKGLKIADQGIHNRRSVDNVIGKLTSFIKPRSGASSVKGWPITSPAQAQGCRFSLDGTILCYYSSEKNQIALYYESHRFPENSGDQFLEPGPTYSHSAYIADIGLTKNYMVIAEKAKSFSFTLVSFIDAQSNAPCFEKQTRISAGAVPSILLIAISPLGRWIACVVGGNTNRSVPGRLYLAKLGNVKQIQNESGELNGIVWRHRNLPEWTGQDATNITALSFSSESSIWFTVKPTQESRACVVRLPCIRDDNQPLMDFERVAFHGPSTDKVASFAPYHERNKCIIITTGNTLVIHDFDHLKLQGTEKRINEHIEVLKIAISRDDHRILAWPNLTVNTGNSIS